jgi:protein TonB
MEDSSARPRRKPKWGTLTLVILFHVIVLAGLARAFAPDLTTAAVERAVSILTVSVGTAEVDPPEEPEQPPEPDEGAEGEAGREATSRETSAPEVKVPVKPAPPAPRASSTGTENRSGAQESGEGTGGAAAGSGTGSGGEGSGQGNGFRKLRKVSGDINSARDYPRDTRELRIGHSVTILLTVGTDGRVKDCRISQPSPDAEADRITCRLAQERFRFEPATDSRGNPIVGKYAWRQRWFY